MRIDSVRTEASGNTILVASGGFLFRLPRSELARLADALAELPPLRPAASPEEALAFLAASAAEIGEDGALAELIRAIDEEARALARAAELCARAEQCREGLILKLASKGFGRKAAARAADLLEAEGILDDSRFAGTWARARLRRRPEGPRLLAAELKAKGLGTAMVQAALASLDFAEVLPRAAEAESRRTGARGEELRSALRAQGFGYADLERFFEASD